MCIHPHLLSFHLRFINFNGQKRLLKVLAVPSSTNPGGRERDSLYTLCDVKNFSGFSSLLPSYQLQVIGFDPWWGLQYNDWCVSVSSSSFSHACVANIYLTLGVHSVTNSCSRGLSQFLPTKAFAKTLMASSFSAKMVPPTAYDWRCYTYAILLLITPEMNLVELKGFWGLGMNCWSIHFIAWQVNAAGHNNLLKQFLIRFLE